jgi:hypothetical protein
MKNLVGDSSLRKSESMVLCLGGRSKRALGRLGPPAKKGERKNFYAGGVAVPNENARFREGNPRKSKAFSLIFFARN